MKPMGLLGAHSVVWLLLTLAGTHTNAAAAEELSADQEIQMVRSMSEASRVATVATNVALTDAESTAFWPIYREYRNRVENLNDEAISLMQELANNFETLTNDRAKSITDRWYMIEKQRIELKQKYANKYVKVLGGVKTARVMQIENRLDALVQIGLLKSIPLVPST